MPDASVVCTSLFLGLGDIPFDRRLRTLRALVITSHDEHFLCKIGVRRWLRLVDGILTETGEPGTPDDV